MIPITYMLATTTMFVNFLFLVGKYYSGSNDILKAIIVSGKVEENLEIIYYFFHQLNQISKLIATFFEYFLLASIGMQFTMLINLLYNMFLIVNGFIQVEAIVIISTMIWIVFQFSIVYFYVIRCEKIHKEISKTFTILWNFNSLKIQNFKKVSKE